MENFGRVPLSSMGVKHRTRLDYWNRCCSSTTNTEFEWGLKYESNHDKKVLPWSIRVLLLVIYDHFNFGYGKSFNIITWYCNWFTLWVEITYLTSVFSDRIGFCFSPIRNLYVMRSAIWYHLHNLKKREKHPWRSIFSKVAGTKRNTPSWVFFTFSKFNKL